MKLSLFTLRSASGDCSLNGITSTETMLTASNDPADVGNPEVDLIVMEGGRGAKSVLDVANTEYVKAVPNKFISGFENGSYQMIEQFVVMSGGNYVTTSDSRYRELTGVEYPIPVHDRCETWEQYEQLSR